MICDTELEDYDVGLCYPPCKYNTDPSGPLCWGDCPNGTEECAGALCIQPNEDCSQKAIDLILNIIGLVNTYADNNDNGTMIDIDTLFTDLTYPNCPQFH